MELKQAGWGRCHYAAAALGLSENTLGTGGPPPGHQQGTTRAPLRRLEAGPTVLVGAVRFSPEQQEQAQRLHSPGGDYHTPDPAKHLVGEVT